MDFYGGAGWTLPLEYDMMLLSYFKEVIEMLQEKYAKLDDLAAPDRYVAPATEGDLAYIAHFRQVCRRYNINFSSADPDERDFVMRMAEKSFLSKRA